MKTQLFLSLHRLIKVLLLLLLISIIIPSAVEGQTTSLSIWPPVLEAMIKPGKSITQVYRLKNSADDTTVTVSVIPFSAADEQGHINLQFGGKLPDYFSLLNADLPELPVTINLNAGETQELVLKISIPAEAEEADYPAALTIQSNTQGLIGGSGTVAQATIASPILLTVSKTGTPDRVAKIEEFLIRSDFLDSFSPIEFILRVKNQSFTRLRAIGQIEISNSFGRNVATLTLQPDNILGGTVRQLKLTSEVKEVPTSEVANLVWNPTFPLGRYTAKVEITPEDTTNTVSQTLVFWVLPYKALLILLTLWIIKLLLTRFKKKSKLNS